MLLRKASLLALTSILTCTLAACGDDDSDSGHDPAETGDLTTTLVGTFTNDGAGGAPNASGSVSVGMNDEGALFVVLGSNFSQEMGPGDTQLYLAQSGDNLDTQRGADTDSVSEALGTIANGYSGSLTFPIPATINLDDLSYVVVWCPTAGINFGSAALN